MGDLTLWDVECRVAKVLREVYAKNGATWCDDEAAHIIDDDLRRDVLLAVANGHPQAQELAAAAFWTEGINFSRWCA